MILKLDLTLPCWIRIRISNADRDQAAKWMQIRLRICTVSNGDYTYLLPYLPFCDQVFYFVGTNCVYCILRRKHKKGVEEDVAKKRTRRTQKFQRAVVGASLNVRFLFIWNCRYHEQHCWSFCVVAAVLWIRNYFFRIRLFRKFRIRLRFRFRIRPNLSVRRQFFLFSRIVDRPGLIFNAINLKISQLIGLIVVYNLWKF